MGVCAAFDATGPYVQGLVGFVDCHAAALGGDGYAALAPGTALGAGLSGLLAIAIALVGYRMLLGEGPSLRDGVSTLLRIGIVLALATQWSAWQPLVYDVVTGGPDELAGAVLSPGGLGGADRAGLVARLQGVENVLDEMVRTDATIAPQTAPQTPQAGAAPQPVANAPTSQPGLRLTAEQRQTITSANGLLLTASLAALLGLHVLAGLLLAVGPLLVGALLFEATRGLFIGWLRVAIGGLLAAVAAGLVVSLALAVAEPQVLALQAAIDARDPLGMMPATLMVSVTLFALLMLVVAGGAALVAFGLRLPDALRQAAAPWLPTPPMPEAALAGMTPALFPHPEAEPRSRAHLVADAVASLDRREQLTLAGGAEAVRTAPEASARRERAGDPPPPAPTGLGQSGVGNSARRPALRATRRDLR